MGVVVAEIGCMAPVYGSGADPAGLRAKNANSAMMTIRSAMLIQSTVLSCCPSAT
jgi:hypothetical protein